MAHVPMTREEELARLNRVLAEIKHQMAEVQGVVRQRWGGVHENRKRMWQDLPHHIHSFDDLVNLSQHALMLGERERDYAMYQRLAEKLERLYVSPYFGRIDFHEDGQPAGDQIYIGLSSLVDGQTGEHLVYDWRAPVCSMFYDSEPGPAAYACDAGVITGQLLLKRQYKIQNGELVYFFDTNIKIDDDMLQELLAKHADDKMRHIVTSIQREQNAIIRDEDHPVLIVQGAAGSGKTSIALHRIAYLLYRYRDSLSADNVVIFSPNDVFSDYISNVLPELGEEPVGQMTFIQYARKLLGNRFHFEEMTEQMDYLLSARGASGYDVRVQGIRFKSSADFLRIIENYVRYLESGSTLPFADVYFRGELIMSREEMLTRLRSQYGDLPFARRLSMIRRRIEYLLRDRLKQAVEQVAQRLAGDPQTVGMSSQEIRRRSRRIVQAKIRETIESIEAWSTVNAFDLYRTLFADTGLMRRLAEGVDLPPQTDAIAGDTLRRLDDRHLGFEDVAPLLYLTLLVEGLPASQGIRHVIVDEAQDYSVFHYRVMRKLFPYSSFTILGDMNQSVHPHMNNGTYEGIQTVFAEQKPRFIRLQRSYRSTRQIAEFTNALLQEGTDTEPIQRDGELPRVVTFVDKHEALQGLAGEIRRLEDQGARSIALVCKTAAESRRVYEALESKFDVVLIGHEDKVFSTGIVVLPVYLAKGLEFDGVIVWDASSDAYSHPDERKAFYTACTRALHWLTLVCPGTPSPFVADVHPNLYTLASGSGDR